MDIMQAFWLGLVQGLTEFLPVSSSGHLLLLQKVFGIANASITFEVLLHAGTLLAVLVVYWRRVWTMITHPLKSELLLLAVATVPAVIAALVFDFGPAFSGEYLGFSFLLTTLILWLSDLVGGLAPKCAHVKWHNAAVMGVMQAVAIMPGISRSGATISGGVATGLSRKRAADFAFLMSIPAILGSMVLHAKDLFAGEGLMTAGGSWIPIAVGVATAAVSGFLAIKLMLAILRRVRLTWFGLYTGVLGVLILLDQYMFHYVF
ncbi:MAG: undecaprenyl-diphosphate phosphatase [Clostridia bacterium]